MQYESIKSHVQRIKELLAEEYEADSLLQRFTEKKTELQRAIGLELIAIKEAIPGYFKEWCNSDEWPLSRNMALAYMAFARGEVRNLYDYGHNYPSADYPIDQGTINRAPTEQTESRYGMVDVGNGLHIPKPIGTILKVTPDGLEEVPTHEISAETLRLASRSNEWFTPPEYIEAARTVMEEIHLDPASSAEANQTIQAKRFWDIKTDGLAQEWMGKVWLNPPYGWINGTSSQEVWSNKLIQQYQGGFIEEAILLVNASPDTTWFHRLLNYPMCFVLGRIKFEPGEGQVQSGATHGNAFVYFGKNERKFYDVFSQFGTIIRKWIP